MQLTNALRDHAFVDLDTKHLYCDAVVNQLGKEIENGRLLRLLIKLTTITERADTDTQWAETGLFDAILQSHPELECLLHNTPHNITIEEQAATSCI